MRLLYLKLILLGKKLQKVEHFMDWIEVIKKIWGCFEELFGDFITMGNLLGIVAIIIAIRTLNFSKRSFLVKDSYDPLLRFLKGAKEIGIYDTKLFKLDFLLDLKRTYIFEAFERKDKNLINTIIERATAINHYKNKADDEIYKATVQVLLEELPKWTKDKQTLIDVELKTSKSLYSIIINGNIFMAYEMKDLEIVCWLGEKVLEVRHEEVGVEEFNVESKGLPLSYYLEETLDKSVLPGNLKLSYNFLDSVEEKIKDRFKGNVEFNQIQESFGSLTKEIDKLIYLLNERVKELLIPYYIFKKIIKRFLFFKKGNG